MDPISSPHMQIQVLDTSNTVESLAHLDIGEISSGKINHPQGLGGLPSWESLQRTITNS